LKARASPARAGEFIPYSGLRTVRELTLSLTGLSHVERAQAFKREGEVSQNLARGGRRNFSGC